MIKVRYSSNNSGGYWWLEDEDWKKLEAAGWEVEWKDDSWLGALAGIAFFKCNNIKEALESFEKNANQDVSDEGCGCCGAPHSFSWENEKGEKDYASGEDCLPILYPNKGEKTLREFYRE